MEDFKNIANFLFEAGILAKTPRSGFHFLGSGEQSVAEHTMRTVYVGYVLGMLDGNVDVSKIMKMCLFHDLPEARVSDLNYIHQKYNERNEHKALNDLTGTLPFGDDIKQSFIEHEEKKTTEAVYVKDADNLEWILSLKEQVDIGNERATEWMDIAVKRLKSELAKNIAKSIIQTDSNEWWFGDKNDDWWVNRIKK
jgi:putative hydrolase of HD superfamily